MPLTHPARQVLGLGLVVVRMGGIAANSALGLMLGRTWAMCDHSSTAVQGTAAVAVVKRDLAEFAGTVSHVCTLCPPFRIAQGI